MEITSDLRSLHKAASALRVCIQQEQDGQIAGVSRQDFEEEFIMQVGAFMGNETGTDYEESACIERLIERISRAESALAEALSKLATAETRDILQAVDERDAAEETLSQMYFLITGRSPEWSNLFGHQEAIEDVDDAQKCLRAEINSQKDCINDYIGENDLIKSCVAEAEAKLERLSAPVGHGVYVASRATIPERSQMWRLLRDSGLPIISSWIDEAGEGETGCFSELWVRIGSEIAHSEALLLYAEAGDFPLKGALVEVGMALALGKPVFVLLPGVEFDSCSMRPVGSWLKHPSVTIIEDIGQAFAARIAPPQ